MILQDFGKVRICSKCDKSKSELERLVDQEPVEGLNPGIRNMVSWLRRQGFETCDSGDGETHDYECDHEAPYVAMIVLKDKLVGEADRLKGLLGQSNIEVGVVDEDGLSPSIQASYDPSDGSAVIFLSGLADKDLPPTWFPEESEA